MTRRKKKNFKLYLLTDRKLSLGRPLTEIVEQALKGGVDAVQLREKGTATAEFIEEARAIKAITDKYAVPLIINDRVDIALAVGADGVHLGQDDMAANEAREIMGQDAIIGLSVTSKIDFLRVDMLEVDYLGVGAIYPTSSKSNAVVSGLEILKFAKDKSRHRIIAIGGINSCNAKSVLEAGADGIAVISAICSAEDPRLASEQLKRIIEQSES